MVDINYIAAQVKENCDISDAKYSGIYSVCGLALRLRDFYRWEKRIEPWGAVPSAGILNWIGEKESKWERIKDNDFKSLEISGNKYPPFETLAINNILKPQGYLYAAGYAHAMKPTFFLAEIRESFQISECNVYILDRELARDLFTAPTLLQGNDIFARRECIRYFLWDKIQEVGQSGKEMLEFALEVYDIDHEEIRVNPDKIKNKLQRLADSELETYIYHEIGEAYDDVFVREEWKEIISSFPYTGIEAFTRAVKDVLSDTNDKGRLRYIIDRKRQGSLGFYVSFLRGFSRLIFPEIISSFWEFRKTGDWDIIEETRNIGHNNARDFAQELTQIYRTGKAMGKEWIKEEINKTLLTPFKV